LALNLLKAKGKIWKASGNKHGHVIYVSANITKDSTYPFEAQEEVVVRLDPEAECLVVSKKEGSS